MRAIKQQDPDGKLLRTYDLSGWTRCTSPASVATRPPRSGHTRCWASRWSTTGGGPRPAGRSPAVSASSACSRSSPARAAGLARLRPARAGRRRPGGAARQDRELSGCRCHPAAARHSGSTMKATRQPTSPTSPAVPHRRRRQHRCGRQRLGHGPHRRHHQRRRPPAVHRPDGGSARVAPAVAECAVVGAKDELKGQTPIGFVVLKAGVDRPDAEIAAELVALVRERIGPVAAFKEARIVARLPKTRSRQDPARLHPSNRRWRDRRRYHRPSRTPALDELRAKLGG